MATCNQYRRLPLSHTFRSNALGYAKPGPKPAADTPPTPPPQLPAIAIATATGQSCPSEPEVTCSDVTYPRHFEAACLHNVLPVITDGPSSQAVRLLRVDGRYGIGVGRYMVGTFANASMGFLTHAPDFGVVPLLRSVGNGTTTVVTQPTALLRASDMVVVVGSGEVWDDATGDTLSSGPALVYVVDGCVTAAFLGNGIGLFDEVYNDVQPGGVPGTWLITGSAKLQNDSSNVAVIHRIDACSGMAVQTSMLLEVPEGITDADPDVATSGVSLAGPTVTGLILVAVQVHMYTLNTNQGLVWAVRATDLTTLAPWTATSFNDPVTGVLRSELSTDVFPLRIFAVENETVVVTSSRLNTATNLPAYAPQVYKFTGDTAPALGFGTSGILTWWMGGLGTTRANDACMTSASTCVVVGNAFSAEVPSGTPGSLQYTVPGFADLDVAVASADVLPQPFVLQVTIPTGCCAPLLTCLPGCAPGHWLSAVTGSRVSGLRLLGDTNYHPGFPSQPAYILDVVTSCDGAIRNGTVVPVPILRAACSLPVVIVDALCGPSPTPLYVSGPVVVGYSETPTQGAIRFDPATGTFQGSDDGVTWKTFQLV